MPSTAAKTPWHDVIGKSACCSAREAPCGKRRSGVTMKNGVFPAPRLETGVPIQAA